MDDPRPIESPTMRAHKRQLAWQILVPFLVVAALIIAAAVLVATGIGSTTRTSADVSTIWLIAPMLILALILVVVLGSLIYGIAMLLKVTPKYAAKAQFYFSTAASGTHKVADGAAKPIVWLQQAGAILKSIFKL